MPQATKQVFGQLGSEHDGGNRHVEIPESGDPTAWGELVSVLDQLPHLSGLTYDSILTQPNMYARGILFGKMKYELGDHSFVRCPELGLSADIEFKTKGYFSGTYNAIGGFIKNDQTGENLFELSGMWTGEMCARDLRVHRHPWI